MEVIFDRYYQTNLLTGIVNLVMLFQGNDGELSHMLLGPWGRLGLRCWGGFAGGAGSKGYCDSAQYGGRDHLHYCASNSVFQQSDTREPNPPI